MRISPGAMARQRVAAVLLACFAGQLAAQAPGQPANAFAATVNSAVNVTWLPPVTGGTVTSYRGWWGLRGNLAMPGLSHQYRGQLPARLAPAVAPRPLGGAGGMSSSSAA